MKIAPTYDRILILPIPEGKVSKGGLLIPAIAERSRVFTYGDVVAVGTGRINAEGKVVPLTLKVGDVAMFARKAGVLVPIPDDDGDDVEHVLLREPDVMAVVTGLARDTGLIGSDGRLLSMVPTSKGLPDVVYKNREEMDIAVREGWTDGEVVTDQFEPGDGPAELSP